MGINARPDVIVHELGHALEEHNKPLFQRTLQYIAERTEGEPLIDLASIEPHYQRGQEYSRPDHFFGYKKGGETGDAAQKRWNHLGAYTGKHYGRQSWNSLEGRYEVGDLTQASEIVSMGLQYMYTDPGGLADQDPDLFMFIYDIRFLTGGDG